MAAKRGSQKAAACLALSVLATLALAVEADDTGQSPVTIEDAIAMVRVQPRAAADGSVASFSPDGTKLAAVTWHGDLPRNTNVYELRVFDLAAPGPVKERLVFSTTFPGDRHDQAATAIGHLQWLPDNRTITLLARDEAGVAQVFSVDTANAAAPRQLTHHRSSVRAFVLEPDGRLKAFSAVAVDPDHEKRFTRLTEDGVFMWERDIFPFQRRFLTPFLAFTHLEPRRLRQYFLTNQAEPFFESSQSRPATPPDWTDPRVAVAPRHTLEDEDALSGWATLTGDPRGHRALLFPYGLTDHPMRPERYKHYATANAYSRRVAAPYGLVDLTTGRVERLVDAPHPQFARDGGAPLWAPDGRTAIIYTLHPLDSPDPVINAQRADEPAQWMEVDITTRRLTPIGIPTGWRVSRWLDTDGSELLLTRGTELARFSRAEDGAWGTFSPIGTASGFNATYPPSSNGRLAVGVKDGLQTPPELALLDLASLQTTILTDLNPNLRRRAFGEVVELQWSHRYEPRAFAFVVKPLDYRPGRRYPLVVLFDNGELRQAGEPFLLDGVNQLSGHAIQTLAAHGFVVLCPRTPASIRKVVETKDEGEYMREHIESAIARLDADGLIDPARVGISGWSRSGYYTNYLMIHSNVAFKAAATIDGGGNEYTGGMRPFTDEELRRIRTPLLLQPHGPSMMVLQAALADRLDALGKAVEILYFPSASHSTVRPRHRWRSLGTHVDWWRFWLQDYEDPAAEKKGQYSQWRRLRALMVPAK